MSDVVEFIAVPNKDKGGTSIDLIALAQAIKTNLSLTLVSKNDLFVTFTGPTEAIDVMRARFAAKLLFEENQTLQQIDPNPFGNTGPSGTDTLSGADKDDDDIVEL